MAVTMEALCLLLPVIACQGQVVRRCRATVLPCDHVVDLVTRVVELLGHPAVFAGAVGSSPNFSYEVAIHETGYVPATVFRSERRAFDLKRATRWPTCS
jgi:hypothetical protein